MLIGFVNWRINKRLVITHFLYTLWPRNFRTLGLFKLSIENYETKIAKLLLFSDLADWANLLYWEHQKLTKRKHLRRKLRGPGVLRKSTQKEVKWSRIAALISTHRYKNFSGYTWQIQCFRLTGKYKKFEKSCSPSLISFFG